jgi:hypothetical protein
VSTQNLKTTVAVLWILQVLNYVTLIILTQVETGNFGTLQSGDNAAPMAVVLAIPCILAWATLALPQSVSRWPNIVFALFFAAIKIGALAQQASVDMSVALYINEVWGLLAALLVAWYAWKMPKASDVPHG